MEPFKANKLPHCYELSKDLLRLLCDAKELYGEYKGHLKSMSFDYKYLLENLLINDIFYSFKIDGSKITKEDMFYMQYKLKSNEVSSFNNIKKMLLYGVTNISVNGLSIDYLNKLHKLLFNECKKTVLIKGSGHLRKKQTYILKPGIAGSSVSFVPPVYSEINGLVKNLCEYFNSNSDEDFISTALTHFQLERLHPYNTGNGKLGRLLIPLQFSYYKKEPPLLFLSESIENLKNTYFTQLSTINSEEAELFIRFFLQCIIDMCQINIKKIKKLNKIYLTDLDSFKKNIGGTTIYKVYPIIIKKIVFTTNDIVSETKLHINSVNKVLNKLVEAGYLEKSKKNDTNRVTFRYNNMYDIFVN